ncbi:I78 family peptidase inhibitor [Cognatishimia activa]|uniref:Peptidase inhibitor I78 family protein n=1 Tax=Cognatishimia activa TaxID=1715691 RepID=A0A0P1IN62_9RHOB|nr:I78 family peptidase inhibitor [Cognatishimia activa]CUJ15719.1 Peptidase inhibitor I78 family protein [Cognatishimia activa]CUK25035.1 Peptidase inhibitor I78 family protein [Cognatishimia activa]
MLIRSVFFFCAAALSVGCTPQAGQTGIDDRDKPYTCDEIVALDVVGMAAMDFDPALLPEKTRILKPGDVATMDLVPTRLNLLTDFNGIITRAYCG